jgi:hypothetical protein
MKYKAYWLHEKGDVVPVETIHIAEVIKDPERFGYSRERIEAQYAKYHEPIGHEGRAREKIMIELIRDNGWVRARYQPHKDTWTIELHSLNDALRELIPAFFRRPEVQSKHQHSDIKITELFRPDGMKKHEPQSARSPVMSDEQKQRLYEHEQKLLEAELRATFVPYLVRVGTERRPSQIIMCGFFGLRRCFFVKEFDCQSSGDELLAAAREAIIEDRNAYNGNVPFFGKKVGYALYPEYGTAIPLSLEGEIRDDVVVAHTSGAISVGIGKSRHGAASSVNVPRFEKKE